MFSYEYCQISRNTYFEEHQQMATSELALGSDCLGFCSRTFAFKAILT